jgi:hypothetical protein
MASGALMGIEFVAGSAWIVPGMRHRQRYGRGPSGGRAPPALADRKGAIEAPLRSSLAQQIARSASSPLLPLQRSSMSHAGCRRHLRHQHRDQRAQARDARRIIRVQSGCWARSATSSGAGEVSARPPLRRLANMVDHQRDIDGRGIHGGTRPMKRPGDHRIDDPGDARQVAGVVGDDQGSTGRP